MMACSENQDIALAQAHALGLFDFFQLGARCRLAGFEPTDLAVTRRIQKHAAANDAGGIGGDAAPFRTARGEQRGRLAIVELTLVCDVVQRIDMGVGVAMARHAEIAHAEGKAALADRQIMHQRHEMHRRVWIVGTGFLADRNRHRDAMAFADERGGGHLVRGDIVERAKLVVCPIGPSS